MSNVNFKYISFIQIFYKIKIKILLLKYNFLLKKLRELLNRTLAHRVFLV